MPFKLRKGKPLAAETKLVFKERIQRAAASVEAYGPDAPDGVHAARKDIKRARALLRLLRQDGFKATRREFNIQLRDISRHLSSNRDREVLVALLGGWAEAATTASLAQACLRLQAALASGTRTIQHLSPELRAAATGQLLKTAARFHKTPLTGLRTPVLRRAAEKCYRRLRGDFACYRVSPGVTEFHNLRKSAKDHVYQRQILAEILQLKPGRTQAVREFEGLLGKARDCDLLLETLRARRGRGLSQRQAACLRRKAVTEKEALLQQAMETGERLLQLDQSEALSR